MKLLQDIIPNKYSSLWYGGDMAEMQYKDIILTIVACGEVRATLLDENDNSKETVIDKVGSGYFNVVMGEYFQNDAELWAMENKGLLVLDNNNWFEVFYSEDGTNEIYSTMVVDDYDNIEIFMKYVENNAEEIYNYIKGDEDDQE